MGKIRIIQHLWFKISGPMLVLPNLRGKKEIKIISGVIERIKSMPETNTGNCMENPQV